MGEKIIIKIITVAAVMKMKEKTTWATMACHNES